MYKKALSGIIFLLMGIMLSGCQKRIEETEYSRDIFAMDTYMSVTGYGANSEQAVNEAIDELQRLDRLISVGNPNSEIARINANGGGELCEDVKYLIEHSLEYSRATNGTYDITVYPVMELWGFWDKSYKVPETRLLQETLKSVDYSKLKILDESLEMEVNQKIDLGGIAKGYASTKIMKIFNKYDLKSGMVYLGGNVQCYKKKPDGSKWVCGIQDPVHPEAGDKYLGIVKVENKAVITSGGYERFFIDEATGEKYHHIIDTRTGYPAQNGLISATIITEDGTLGDAFSTAVYAMGKDEAIELWRSSKYEFDMILMTEDEKVYVTAGISKDFTSDYDIQVVE